MVTFHLLMKHQSSGSQKMTFRTKQISTVFTAWRLHSISHKCKVTHFTVLWSKVGRAPTIRIYDTLLPVDDSTKSLWVWWNSHISSKKHVGGLKPVQWCPQSRPSGCTLKMGRGRDAFLMLYRAIVRSKMDHGSHCVWYSIEYHPATIGQHPRYWINIGTWSLLHQSSLQNVHRS